MQGGRATASHSKCVVVVIVSLLPDGRKRLANAHIQPDGDVCEEKKAVELFGDIFHGPCCLSLHLQRQIAWVNVRDGLSFSQVQRGVKATLAVDEITRAGSVPITVALPVPWDLEKFALHDG
jgi:hypothetical protein